MKCDHIVSLFDSYLNGTASIDDVAALEQHIATCESCRNRLELYRFYFRDTTIEDDFPVPSQLNAKIKYAIHQESSKKKMPFWQNKRILSAATACALLFTVGIFGASHYAKMKEVAQTPSVESTDSIKAVKETAPSAEFPKDPKKIPESKSTTEEIVNSPATADLSALPEETAQIPAYSGDTSAATSTEFKISTRAIPRVITESSYDALLAEQWMEPILTKFPHEVLEDNTYLITATKQELEEFLGFSTGVTENKEQLVLKFVEITE